MKTNSLDLQNLDMCLNKTIDIIKDYIKNISNDPVIPNIEREQLNNILHCDIPFKGIGVEKVLDEVKEKVLPYCTKIGHPKFLSWIITSPSPAGTIGEMLNLALNQVPFCFKSGPAVTVIEDMVLSWFIKLFGYSEQAGGILVSGGTSGTLTGLTVARNFHFPNCMKDGLQGIEKSPVVYVSSVAHKSVDTAVSILGIGTKFLRKIPVDKHFKMDVNKLEDAIKKDIKLGYKPFCVIAQAGTSNEGVIDDINTISYTCNKYNLWLHVDAAYAGGSILTKKGKNLMKGIEKADSISTDPHKWFFIPVEAGCVLVKDRKNLFNTFKTNNADFNESSPIEYSNYGIQFTRMSRAFKIWFAFKSYGINKIAEIVNQNMDLAIEFANKIEQSKNWELVVPPETSAVCFRYIPNLSYSETELNNLQNQILTKLELSGQAFLSSATVNNDVCLRACFSNHRTNYNDLTNIFKSLCNIAKDLTV